MRRAVTSLVHRDCQPCWVLPGRVEDLSRGIGPAVEPAPHSQAEPAAQQPSQPIAMPVHTSPANPPAFGRAG